MPFKSREARAQYDRLRKFTQAFLPRFTERVKKYEGRRPIFDHYHIEPALRLAVARRVPLRSGGSLVIDQGEALTAIDINTGSFTNAGSGSLSTTTDRLTCILRQLEWRKLRASVPVAAGLPAFACSYHP